MQLSLALEPPPPLPTCPLPPYTGIQPRQEKRVSRIINENLRVGAQKPTICIPPRLTQKTGRLVQSLNSPFRAPYIGGVPERARALHGIEPERAGALHRVEPERARALRRG